MIPINNWSNETGILFLEKIKKDLGLHNEVSQGNGPFKHLLLYEINQEIKLWIQYINNKKILKLCFIVYGLSKNYSFEEIEIMQNELSKMFIDIKYRDTEGSYAFF